MVARIPFQQFFSACLHSPTPVRLPSNLYVDMIPANWLLPILDGSSFQEQLSTVLRLAGKEIAEIERVGWHTTWTENRTIKIGAIPGDPTKKITLVDFMKQIQDTKLQAPVSEHYTFPNFMGKVMDPDFGQCIEPDNPVTITGLPATWSGTTGDELYKFINDISWGLGYRFEIYWNDRGGSFTAYVPRSSVGEIRAHGHPICVYFAARTLFYTHLQFCRVMNKAKCLTLNPDQSLEIDITGIDPNALKKIVSVHDDKKKPSSNEIASQIMSLIGLSSTPRIAFEPSDVQCSISSSYLDFDRAVQLEPHKQSPITIRLQEQQLK